MLHTVAKCKGVNLILKALLGAVRKLGRSFSTLLCVWLMEEEICNSQMCSKTCLLSPRET